MEDLLRAEIESIGCKLIEKLFTNFKMLVSKIILFVLVVFFDNNPEPDIIFTKSKILSYWFLLENVYLTSILPIKKKYKNLKKNVKKENKEEVMMQVLYKKAMEKCIYNKVLNLDKLNELIINM